MRIVGGDFRGKKLIMPDDKRIRPTADRTREALYNILGHGESFRTDNGPLPLKARVLDVFAGTGALGLEALSRGADHVTFMDNHSASLTIIRQNIAALKAQNRADILNRNGINPGKASHPVDLILMDPPYGEELAVPSLAALMEGGWISENTITVIEVATKEKTDLPDGFELLDNRKYGAARLLILKRA